jgi:hypothetical protein
MYKDEKIIEGIGDAIIRNLPLFVFLFGVNILREFISWPSAMGIAAFGFGLVSYWIPNKSKRNFLLWMLVSTFVGVACFGFAHLFI